MTKELRNELAEQLSRQAGWCAQLDSKLYAALLAEASSDAAKGGPVWRALRDHLPAPQMEVMLPLRFMAAMHTLVLRGRASELARFYPSVGGDGKPEDAWPAFASTLDEHLDEVRSLSRLPVQTNEVGRCASLIGGFLRVAAETSKPLRLLEVGASAGLNLRWDRYRYESLGGSWGPKDSPVRLTWDAPPPHLDAPVEIGERRGCDPSPLNPLGEHDRVRLLSVVWPDQLDRVERLRGAFAVAPAVPVELDEGSASVLVPRWLEQPITGAATIVFHSVVLQYMSDEERDGFLQTLEVAGNEATRAAPLAHLSFEPGAELPGFAVRLRIWPGGGQVLVANSGPHGRDIVWM